MPAKLLMIQGTASHVGKSVMTAAICRILKNKGFRVAPFKAQNMSNNSYVPLGGGEIGRAQAEQAAACGIEPSILMNPVLLKPDSDAKAQVVVMGKPVGYMQGLMDDGYKESLEPVVHNALNELRQSHDIVVIEGAGSPAEVNLKDRDIVNMGLAKAFNIPVILLADIDWGGVFAQCVGTLELLDPDERKLVKGFLINKFRGDKSLLKPGLDWLEEKTQRKVLGVIPFVSDLDFAEEDSISNSDSSHISGGLRANLNLDQISGRSRDPREQAVPQDHLLIDVMWLPRISNFTDFDLLQREEKVTLRYLHQPDRHRIPDLVIIPGTKNTVSDLEYLEKSGLKDYVLKAYRAGASILGICGGFQMLGQNILDPDQAESKLPQVKGLGLLSMDTVYSKEKTTERIKAIHIESGLSVEGYEIHMGQRANHAEDDSLFKIIERDGQPVEAVYEGVIISNSENSNKSHVYGTYLHGALNNKEFLTHFLSKIRDERGLGQVKPAGLAEDRPDVYEQLAQKVEKHIDIKQLMTMIN